MFTFAYIRGNLYAEEGHIAMTTGERIGQLAEERGISLHKLATLAGVSYNTVYSAVKRKSDRLDKKTVENIATVLEVPPSDILGYEIRDLDDCSFAIIDGDRVDPEVAKKLGHEHPKGCHIGIMLKTEREKNDLINLLHNGPGPNDEIERLLSIYQKLNFIGRQILLSNAENLLKHCAIDSSPRSEE